MMTLVHFDEAICYITSDAIILGNIPL